MRVFDPIPPSSGLSMAIAECLRQFNGRTTMPYCLSFGGDWRTGACFGVFQADCATRRTAHDCLIDIMHACHLPRGQIARIGDILRHATNRNPLGPGDTATLAAALASPIGRARIDRHDAHTLETINRHVAQVLAQAERANRHLTVEAILYTALWIHVTGSPTRIGRWIAGYPIDCIDGTGIPPIPPSGDITGSMLCLYLQATCFVRENPTNLDRFHQSVANRPRSIDQVAA